MPAPKRNTAPRPPQALAAPSREQAAEARRDAFENVKPSDRGMVDALLAERLGYERRGGMTDRIAQVDHELRVRGYGA